MPALAQARIELGPRPENRYQLRSGKRYRIVVGRRVQVFARLFDAAGEQPLADLPYRLQLPDGSALAGRTDTTGLLRHRPLPPGTFRLELDDPHGTPRSLALPFLGLEREAPHLQTVPGFGTKVQVFVQLFDATGAAPLAGRAYRLRGPDGERRGLCDGAGVLRERGCVPGNYTLVIRDAGTDRTVGVPWLEAHRATPHRQVVPGITLEPAHQLLVRLFDATSRRPLAGVPCRLEGPDGARHDLVTDPDGLLRQPAAPGRWTLQATAPDGRALRRGLPALPAAAEAPVLLALPWGLAGPRQVRIQLFGRDGKPRAGLAWSLEAGGEEVARGSSDPAGRIEARGLDDRPCSLRLAGAPAQRVPFSEGAPHLLLVPTS